MKKHWIKGFIILLITLIAAVIAGNFTASVKAEEGRDQVYTDENGRRFRIVPLGDGRYELWQLVDVQKGSSGETILIDEKECSHEHRRWGTGNEQFHWEECLDCGKLFPPEVHAYNETNVVTAATCKQNAVLKRSCICGRTDEKNTGPKEGDPAEYFAHHTWSGTYESDLFGHWRRCTVCGEWGDSQVHAVINLKTEKEPTCFRDGEVSFDCSVCGGHFITDAGYNMTEHYPELKQYQALGHDFSGPLKVASGPKKAEERESGTHAASCIRCGLADYNNTMPHSWSEYTISNGTCEDENDPVIIGGTCECGASLELSYVRHHSFVKDDSRDRQPTCIEPGKINGERCLFCGIFGNYDFIEALGHEWVEDESLRKEPTCLEDGEKHEHCSRCDAERTVPLKSKNTYRQHVFVVHTIQEAKCGEIGWWEKVCKYCDTPDGNGITFEKLAHDNSYVTKEKELDLRRLDNGTIVRPVICTTTITCARCGKTRVEERTVYKSIKGTGFKIVRGRDPGIKDLVDGEHPSGQFSKDPLFFESEIQRALKKDIEKGLEQYNYDK